MALTPTAVRGAAETAKSVWATPSLTSMYSAPMASETSFQPGSEVSVKETVTVWPGVRERRKARSTS